MLGEAGALIMLMTDNAGHIIEFIQDIPRPFMPPCPSVKYQDSSCFEIQGLSKEHVFSLSQPHYSVWLGNLGECLWNMFVVTGTITYSVRLGGSSLLIIFFSFHPYPPPDKNTKAPVI